MSNNQKTNQDLSYKDKLYMVLIEEIHAYQYLADTVKEKQKVIIKNQLDELENLTGIERLLVKKVEILLKTREEYLRKAALERSPKPIVRLRDFIGLLDKNEQPRWKSLEERIYRTVEKIRRINLENQQLIRSSLNFINGLVEMLYPQEEGAQSLYTAHGQTNTKAAIKSLVNVNI